MKLKAYNWALEGAAALVLLAGVIGMILTGDEMQLIIVRLVGLGVLFFTLMRIKPILASRNEKDYLIIMLLEILLALVVGVMFLFIPQHIKDDSLLSFSRLTGVVFYVRGIVHFYTTAKRYELHDVVGFVVHVLLISFGFLFLFSPFGLDKVLWIIYFLSFVLSGYFAYRSWTGYKRFRIEKENQLKIQDYMEKDKHDEKKIDDPKSIEDHINPVIIDEPEEERPHLDVQ